MEICESPEPPTQAEFVQELIGLSNEEICQFFHLQPGMCDSRNWQQFPNITITYVPINWRQWWIDTFNAQAFFLQDVATSISSFGAGLEAAAILAGCSAAFPIGCGAGWAAGMELYAPLNIFETAFSGASLGMTVAADMLDGGSLLNPNESTRTAFVTAAVGAAIPDAILDAYIDQYSSKYNRGLACGISTVFTAGCN